MTRSLRGAVAAPVVQPTEPIWYLRSISYGDYRNTNYWRKRREEFRQSRHACALCGLHPLDQGFKIAFHVHHLSYARLGYERDEDLELLCSACHNLVHRPESAAAQNWVRVREFENPDLAEQAKALLPAELGDE